MSPDKKSKAGITGDYLFPEEQKWYMTQNRCFFCHSIGHGKRDCPKWAAVKASKGPVSTVAVATAVPVTPDPPTSTNAVFPALNPIPEVRFEAKEGAAEEEPKALI